MILKKEYRIIPRAIRHTKYRVILRQVVEELGTDEK